MPVGIPSTNQSLPVSAEVLQWKSKQGLPGSIPGQVFQQSTASTALTNSTTETNLVTQANGRGTAQIPAGALAWNNFYDPTGPVSTGSAGCKVKVKVIGTITNTLTPTLRVRLGFTNGAGATTFVADTTALATASITGTSRFVAEFDLLVTTYAVAGVVLGGGYYEYFPTTLTTNKFYAPQLSTSSFDTTQAYTVGVFATWGTASASNTIVAQDISIEIQN